MDSIVGVRGKELVVTTGNQKTSYDLHDPWSAATQIGILHTVMHRLERERDEARRDLELGLGRTEQTLVYLLRKTMREVDEALDREAVAERTKIDLERERDEARERIDAMETERTIREAYVANVERERDELKEARDECERQFQAKVLVIAALLAERDTSKEVE